MPSRFEKLDQLPSLWNVRNALSREIEVQAQSVDYSRLLGDSRVLMLGESHDNSAIRLHIAQYAANLKRAGITHYGIEAPPNPLFDELNNGSSADLSSIPLGPWPHAFGYETAVSAVLAEGIKVVPIDIELSPTPSAEERETYIAGAIAAVLDSDPAAKIAVLIGRCHIDKRERKYEPKAWAARKLTDMGIDVVSAPIIGGSSGIPRGFLEASRVAGLSQEEFMLDLRPYQDQKGVVFGTGAVDHVVHLPQEASFGQQHLGAVIRLYTKARMIDPILGG